LISGSREVVQRKTKPTYIRVVSRLFLFASDNLKGLEMDENAS
jgi:hypothetical protein